MIEVKDLQKSFGDAHILKGINTVFEKGKTTYSYAFSVSGDFNSILGLAYELEQRSKFGMVKSLEFEKIKSFRTGKTALEGQFILQLVQ